MLKKLRSHTKSGWTFLFFVILYAVIFIGLRHGAGNNWDWETPYFSSQASAVFTKALSSWQESGLGSPIGFAPGVYFLLLEGAILRTGLAPEYFIYGGLTLLFAIGSFTVFQTLRDKSRPLALLTALAVFINPAIFYKLLAGHVIYLVGYLFYVCLVCYLIKSYQYRFRDGVVTGLLFALSIIQVQFLVFSALTIFLFFLARLREKRPSWKELAAIILLPIALHIFWLSGFLTGASSVSALSQAAQVNSFTALSYASLKEIGLLIFSGATFIRYFYSKPEMIVFGCFWLLVGYGAISQRFRLNWEKKFLVAGLTVFTFIASGIFQKVPVPVLKTFYPMLREAGHAAPLVVFYLGLAAFYLLYSNAKAAKFLAVYLFIFITISIPVYFSSIPRVNFSQARQQFSAFIPYLNDSSPTARIVTYPFFNQYGFNNQPTTYKDGTPVSNSGWDSFIIFSSKPYVENATSPETITSSLQYQFLQDYDVSALASQGVKYIYNFSDIYHSNVAAFINPAIYNQQPIGQPDPLFFQHIEAKNPGQVTEITPNILEINNVPPILTGDVSGVTKISSEKYQATVTATTGQASINLLEAYNNGWKITDSNGKTIPATHSLGAGQFNSWTIDVTDLGPQKQVEIVYQPQTAYVDTLILSVATLGVTLAYLYISRKKEASSERSF